MTTQFQYPDGFKPFLIPIRYHDKEEGLKAMKDFDFTHGLRPGDPGFEEAPFEIGLWYGEPPPNQKT